MDTTDTDTRPTVDHGGPRPVEVLPSGEYAVYVPPPTRWDVAMGQTVPPDRRPVVQVAQWIAPRGTTPGFWSPTPGRWLAETVAHYADGQDVRLSIDFGAHWSIPPRDTWALGSFARTLVDAARGA